MVNAVRNIGIFLIAICVIMEIIVYLYKKYFERMYKEKYSEGEFLLYAKNLSDQQGVECTYEKTKHYSASYDKIISYPKKEKYTLLDRIAIIHELGHIVDFGEMRNSFSKLQIGVRVLDIIALLVSVLLPILIFVYNVQTSHLFLIVSSSTVVISILGLMLTLRNEYKAVKFCNVNLRIKHVSMFNISVASTQIFELLLFVYFRVVILLLIISKI